MKKKHQNAFFLFGITLLVAMLTQLDYKEVIHGITHSGYWFLCVVCLWAVLYIFNTYTWHIIIKAGRNQLDYTDNRNEPSFWTLYKLTISGFALNYATPGGLMGGEPYRIMALSPAIGTERATSSVILFAMTHIFSHFWFWLMAVGIYVAIMPVDALMGILLTATTAFCMLGLWFFIVGYRKGLANRAMRILKCMPFIRKWAERFINQHREQLDNIDKQIAALHRQNTPTFIKALMSELTCRIVSSAEIMFVLLVIYPKVNFLHCILILAFTSLFANLLFFMPLQIGGREGGFLMSVKSMAMTASDGIFVALIVRLRELIWTTIGLLLIKLTPKQKITVNQPPENQ